MVAFWSRFLSWVKPEQILFHEGEAVLYQHNNQKVLVRIDSDPVASEQAPGEVCYVAKWPDKTRNLIIARNIIEYEGKLAE